MNNKVEVSISPRTIRNIILIAVAILLIWKLSSIFILLITAIMVASALNPAVEWLNKKLSITLSAALVVIGLILPLIYVLGAVIPDFISQFPVITTRVTTAISNADFLPSYLRQIDLNQYFQSGGTYLLESTKIIGNFFFEAITFIFMIFYLLIDGSALHRFALIAVPKASRAKVEKISVELGHISGKYIRGNLLISLICFLVIFAGLLVLQVPYALPLAIFAGVFDLLPLIGSTIGAVPAVILAFTISPLTGLLTLALFAAYQAIENNILAPNIYNKVLNLLPFLSFVTVIIGSLMFGIAGAFLALPIAAGIPTIIKYYENNK